MHFHKNLKIPSELKTSFVSILTLFIFVFRRFLYFSCLYSHLLHYFLQKGYCIHRVHIDVFLFFLFTKFIFYKNTSVSITGILAVFVFFFFRQILIVFKWFFCSIYLFFVLIFCCHFLHIELKTENSFFSTEEKVKAILLGNAEKLFLFTYLPIVLFVII